MSSAPSSNHAGPLPESAGRWLDPALAALAVSAAVSAAILPPLVLAAIVGAMCLLVALARSARWEPDRGLRWAAWGVLALAAKDLLPTFPISGEVERLAATAGGGLRWPFTARNPQLASGAAQIAGLLLALAWVAATSSYAAQRAGRVRGVLSWLAWSTTGFGLLVILTCNAAKPYGPGNCVGLIANKNGAGTLAALGALVHAGLAWHGFRQEQRRPFVVHAFGALVLLGAMVQLGSRTALVALATGVAVYLMLGPSLSSRSLRRMPVALATAGAVALALVVLQPQLGPRGPVFSEDYRVEIWLDALRMLATYPWFGIGLGAFEHVYPLFGAMPLPLDARMVHPDSSWVKLVTEWGLVPAIAAVIGAGIWARRRFTDIRERRHSDEIRELAVIAIAALGALAASGISDITLYRLPTLLYGATALGLISAASRSDSPAQHTSRLQCLPLALLLVGEVAAVVAGYGRNRLAMNLLAPDLLWENSSIATHAGGFRIDRLRAAVRLQHRSLSFPLAAAQMVHAANPEQALEFWRVALTRAESRAAEFFSQAMKDFPTTPPAYWLRVAAATDADLALLVPLPAAERAGVITSWIGRHQQQRVETPNARRMLDATQAASRPDLLAKAVTEIHVDDPAFWERAARTLQSAGLAKPAWQAIEHVVPPTEARSAPTATAPAISTDLLIKLGRFIELRERLVTLAADDHATHRALLEQVCALPQAPAWFHLQLARELGEAGEHDAAVTTALHGLEQSRAVAKKV